MHDRSLGRAVDEIENLRHGFNTANLLAGSADHVGKPAFQRKFDFANDLGVGLLHVGNTAHHLDLLCRRKANENLARLVMRQMTHDQRDCLRMLFLNEGEQVLALRLLQKRERRALNLGLNLLDDLLGGLGIKRILQQTAGVIEAALAHISLRHRQRIELADHLLTEFLGHIAQRRKGARDFLDHFGRHLLEQLSCAIGVEQQQQDRALQRAVDFVRRFWKFGAGAEGHRRILSNSS